jgi:hypothetical protein
MALPGLGRAKASSVRPCLGYCSTLGLPTASLSFVVRPSEEALPGLDGSDERDLFLIDGSHGFPLPIIDWFYGAAHLRQGGMVVFDDAHLPQLGPILQFRDLDPRWEPVGSTSKWRAYRRLSSGSLAEDHYQQLFFTRAGLTSWGSALSPARRLLRRIGPKRARAGDGPVTWGLSHLDALLMAGSGGKLKVQP